LRTAGPPQDYIDRAETPPVLYCVAGLSMDTERLRELLDLGLQRHRDATEGAAETSDGMYYRPVDDAHKEPQIPPPDADAGGRYCLR
jgi:hypothetical protein